MSRYKIYKDVTDTCVCLYCCYELYNSKLINAPYVMFFYSILDLPFNTTSLKIHHGVAAICALTYICSESTKAKHDFLLQFMKCEYSTIFLCLNNFLGYIQNKNSIIKMARKSSQVAFVVSFFQYRICNIFNILVNNGEYLNGNIIYHIGTYALYTLNLYWFTKIIRKISKLLHYYISLNITRILYIQQYLYLSVPFYNGVIIGSNVSVSYILYYFATCVYCLFGYMYNNDYYNSLMNKTKVNPHFYLYEKFSIHFRSFVGLFAVSLYKGSKFDFIFVLISFISHIYMLNYFYIDYYKEFHIPPMVLKHEKNVYKLPIVFDNICLYLLCEPYDKHMVNTLLFLLIFITYVQPFGKNNYHCIIYPFIMNYMAIRGF